MDTLSVTQVLQFYAPFAGLLGVVFWVGVLSQRVADLRERVKKLEAADDTDGSGERLVRLEVNTENMTKAVESMKRSMDGVQRQLGNLMNKPIPHDFGADHGG